MPTAAPEPDDPDFNGAAALGRVDARREDAYWRQAHRRQRYYDHRLDYEDYAPAYCVGYIGYAQYGGTFDDAQPWLCANWQRIKGDSRLSPGQALLAMRSAWDRLASQECQPRRRGRCVARRTAPTTVEEGVLQTRQGARALNDESAFVAPALI